MKRSVEIDLAKTIAIFGVVMIHVTAQFLLLHGSVGTWQYDSAIFWRVLAGLGVPLFLMCSGALMLRPEKELTLKRLYLHNVLRLVVAMLVWAIAYKLWIPLLKHQLTAAFVIQSVKEVLVFNQQFHLYYIHIMLIKRPEAPDGYAQLCEKRDREGDEIFPGVLVCFRHPVPDRQGLLAV